MDFSFSDDHIQIRDLARGILEKEMTPERVKAAAGAEYFDAPLWQTLAETGLLGVAVPESLGGMGFGIAEACVLLQEIGRALAVVPAFPTLVLGALPIAAFGSDAQKRRWLPALAAGTTLLTGALVDAGSSDPATPATSARKDGPAWIVEGRKTEVRGAHLAQAMLIPARTNEGVGVFLVDPHAGGVTCTRHVTSTGEPVCTVDLSGTRVDDEALLGAGRRSGGDAVAWLYDNALVATCAMHIGVLERMMELTSNYVREREQFGVAIGSFQAVQHRLANCHIDLEAMRWVTWRAIWKLSVGLPASRDAAVAKFWCAEGGARIATAALHVHGGMGVDVDYPIHRYFLWSKALELCLDGASSHLARVGRDMARTGVPEPL